MKFTIQRERLLEPLQMVLGAVVENRQSLPILSHTLMQIVFPDPPKKTAQLFLTTTDTEIEIIGFCEVEQVEQPGAVTVSARKLIDICRALPEKSVLSFSLEGEQLLLSSSYSNFSLVTRKAEDFPRVERDRSDFEFSISQDILKSLINRTYFAISEQDVRRFFNGMLWEIQEGCINAVASNGHRLAFSSVSMPLSLSKKQIIVPKKGAMELQRLLSHEEGDVLVSISSHQVCFESDKICLSSKLIDATFPDYHYIIPKKGDNDKQITIERDQFKEVLSRVAILTNEKFKGVRLVFDEKGVLVFANNPENEAAEEQLNIDYKGEPLKIDLNINYLLDILTVLPAGDVRLTFQAENKPILVESLSDKDSLYVVMPLKL